MLKLLDSKYTLKERRERKALRLVGPFGGVEGKNGGSNIADLMCVK